MSANHLMSAETDLQPPELQNKIAARWKGVNYVHCLGSYEYKLYTFFHVFCVSLVLLSAVCVCV
jgi:hypothetical protein